LFWEKERTGKAGHRLRHNESGCAKAERIKSVLLTGLRKGVLQSKLVETMPASSLTARLPPTGGFLARKRKDQFLISSKGPGRLIFESTIQRSASQIYCHNKQHCGVITAGAADIDSHNQEGELQWL